LEAFLAVLTGTGVKVITLEVRKGNSVAQSVYAGLGFRSVGLRPAFYDTNGEDALIMRLECR